MSNTTTMFDYKGEIFSGRELLAIEVGREIERTQIIKLVERFGFNEELGFSFEQAKEDLLTLIKGEK